MQVACFLLQVASKTSNQSLGLHVLALEAAFFSMLLDSLVGLEYFVDSYVVESSIQIFKHTKIDTNMYEHTILNCP
jgi:hypothetical protein